MANELEEAKSVRNATYRAFQAKLAQVREDLSARSIGGRIADRAGEAVAEAVDAANDHKGVVAGTIALLGAWFLRGPLIRGLSHALPVLGKLKGNADD